MAEFEDQVLFDGMVGEYVAVVTVAITRQFHFQVEHEGSQFEFYAGSYLLEDIDNGTSFFETFEFHGKSSKIRVIGGIDTISFEVTTNSLSKEFTFPRNWVSDISDRAHAIKWPRID